MDLRLFFITWFWCGLYLHPGYVKRASWGHSDRGTLGTPDPARGCQGGRVERDFGGPGGFRVPV